MYTNEDNYEDVDDIKINSDLNVEVDIDVDVDFDIEVEKIKKLFFDKRQTIKEFILTRSDNEKLELYIPESYEGKFKKDFNINKINNPKNNTSEQELSSSLNKFFQYFIYNELKRSIETRIEQSYEYQVLFFVKISK